MYTSFPDNITVTAHILSFVLYVGMDNQYNDNNELKNKHGERGGGIDNVPLP